MKKALSLNRWLSWSLALAMLFFFSNTLFASSFELQNSLSESKFRFLFPAAKLSQVDRVNSVKLIPALRTKFWPNRIPFGVALDQNQQKAYALVYPSFFSRKVIDFASGDLKNPQDITASESGEIAIADPNLNKILLYSLKKTYEAPTQNSSIRFPKVFRVEFGPNVLAACSKDNLCSVFQNTEQGWLKNRELSKTLSDQLNEHIVIDLTITPQSQLTILTDKSIIELNLMNENLKKTDIDHSFTAIENTIHGELLFLDNLNQRIVKYSKNLDILTELDLSHFDSNSLSDFTVYESFGYVAIASKSYGEYYGMGVDILDIDIEKQTSVNDTDFHNINFTLTFPAKVSVKISDPKTNTSKVLLSNKTLPARRHSLYWDGHIINHESLSNSAKLQLTAKALYSLSNTSKKDLVFELP